MYLSSFSDAITEYHRPSHLKTVVMIRLKRQLGKFSNNLGVRPLRHARL